MKAASMFLFMAQAFADIDKIIWDTIEEEKTNKSSIKRLPRKLKKKLKKLVQYKV